MIHTEDLSPWERRVWALGGVVAIPFLVAWVAGVFEDRSARKTANAQIVMVAVGVLQDKADDVDAALRGWAVDVLANPNDPPPLSPEAASALRSGQSVLPAFEGVNSLRGTFNSARKLGEISFLTKEDLGSELYEALLRFHRNHESPQQQ